MNNEVAIDSALEEIEQHTATSLALCDTPTRSGEPTVSRYWFPPAKTFIYHTVSAIEDANHKTLDDVAQVFFNANQLKSQPWYPAFLDGWSEPLDAPTPSYVMSAARGQASFDFGLRKPRYYNQLVVSFSPDEDTRGIALRSITGLPQRRDQVKAYTLSPTVDLLRLRDGRLEWHHIVTVAGPALLPPGADRLLMNTLRRLRLDHAERNTYLDEARRLAAIEPEEWAHLRAQIND
ncbi:MAG: hypothetical protein ABJK20_12305 [Halieaceae bacterium]